MVHYPSRQERDGEWGLACISVGRRDGGAEVPRMKDEHRLIYVTGGSGRFKSTSCPETTVIEGDMIMVFADEKYTLEPREDAGFSETWVGFWACSDAVSRISKFFDKASPVLSIGSSDTVFDLYGRLIYLAGAEKPGCQEAMGGFIYALLGYVHHKAASLSVSKLKNVGKIQQAQMMLRSDLPSRISPAAVASSVGMSYSLLREQFKAVTGMSMSDYQLSQRINLAKTLLSSSDKSIKEIAFETGYESMTRFCCAFKKAVGIPATEFRSRNSK